MRGALREGLAFAGGPARSLGPITRTDKVGSVIGASALMSQSIGLWRSGRPFELG